MLSSSSSCCLSPLLLHHLKSSTSLKSLQLCSISSIRSFSSLKEKSKFSSKNSSSLKKKSTLPPPTSNSNFHFKKVEKNKPTTQLTPTNDKKDVTDDNKQEETVPSQELLLEKQQPQEKSQEPQLQKQEQEQKEQSQQEKLKEQQEPQTTLQQESSQPSNESQKQTTEEPLLQKPSTPNNNNNNNYDNTNNNNNNSNVKRTKSHLQQLDPLWKGLQQAFSNRNALNYLEPSMLERALSHKLTIQNLPKTPADELPLLVSDRLVHLGHSLAELQLTEYYLDLLPRGATLAARICLYKKNLYEVGRSMGLDKLLHHQFLVTGSYQVPHNLPESKRLELATAETVLALVAAVHLHHTAAKTNPTPLFSHRYIALPLTLSQLIREHRPRQVLDTYLRSRTKPESVINAQKPWNAQTHPPPTSSLHSSFAIYKILEEVKGVTPLFTVGVYVDGKLLATEYGTTVHEAEEMAAVRALEILRSNAIQEAAVAKDQESE